MNRIEALFIQGVTISNKNTVLPSEPVHYCKLPIPEQLVLLLCNRQARTNFEKLSEDSKITVKLDSAYASIIECMTQRLQCWN